MPPRVPSSRATALEGVRVAQMLFEQHGCAFQEVAQQNDFGKDAYVDLAADGAVTPLCVAIQIKSGTSYRTRSGDYAVPLGQHADTWRDSTVPVFGIVYDPNDHGLRWIDLTGYLRAHSEVCSGSVPIPKGALLTSDTLRGAFATAVMQYMEWGSDSGDIALHLLSQNDAFQDNAVLDAWALGRRDARHLLIVRRLLLELRPRALRRAICLLSYCGSHPDVFWTPDNWIPPEIERAVLPSFRWSPQETAHMIAGVDVSDYGRGSLGQCLDVLLHEDPDARASIRAAVGLLHRNSLDLAVRAATLALIRVKDQAAELAVLREQYPALETHDWFADIAAAVDEAGELSLY